MPSKRHAGGNKGTDAKRCEELRAGLQVFGKHERGKRVSQSHRCCHYTIRQGRVSVSLLRGDFSEVGAARKWVWLCVAVCRHVSLNNGLLCGHNYVPFAGIEIAVSSFPMNFPVEGALLGDAGRQSSNPNQHG